MRGLAMTARYTDREKRRDYVTLDCLFILGTVLPAKKGFE
jgi:hypothetical protein